MQQRKSNRASAVFLYLILILILLTLLVTASYTWFTISRTPRVSNLDIYVNAPSGLELAPSLDTGEWGQQISFGALGLNDTPLKPCTWSDQDNTFYAMVYGMDGRQTGEWLPLNDRTNANRDDAYGYYVCASVYARAGEKYKIHLTPAMEVEEGVSGAGTYLVGTPEWDAQQIIHNNGGTGAEFAVRLGFRVTLVDAAGEPLADPGDLIIYEPNSDGHPGGALGYVSTPSIDGTEHLVPEERLICQTTSLWTEADPVERSVVVYDMGEFTTDTYLFDLEAGQTARIDIYIWLEGQDVDCTNMITEAQIMANLQFAAEVGDQSGMVPIE